MKAGIVPHEHINSRIHGIYINKNHTHSVFCTTRTPSEITKAETLRPSDSGFLLGDFFGVLVEQNTSLGVFYYDLTIRSTRLMIHIIEVGLGYMSTTEISDQHRNIRNIILINLLFT